MATGNASQSVPPILTSFLAMAGSSAAAQQPISIATLQQMPSTAQ